VLFACLVTVSFSQQFQRNGGDVLNRYTKLQLASKLAKSNIYNIGAGRSLPIPFLGLELREILHSMNPQGSWNSTINHVPNGYYLEATKTQPANKSSVEFMAHLISYITTPGRIQQD